MYAVVNNYSDSDLSWIRCPMTVYDKKEKNVGYNIYDYMDYIVNNYSNLPDVILFTKGNMLERHITPAEWEKIKDNKTFTPILTQSHNTIPGISHYKDGLYYEKNDSWYLYSYPNKYFKSYKQFANIYNLPNPEYLGFAPGACYIVPKENILRHNIVTYLSLRKLVDWHQTPAEAHLIERSLYNLWS